MNHHVTLNLDTLERMRGADRELAMTIALTVHTMRLLRMLPLDFDQCCGIAGAYSRADRELCQSVLDKHFVVTELGRRPGLQLLRMPRNAELAPAELRNPNVTPPVTPTVTPAGVTGDVTVTARMQRYRGRIDELRDQAERMGIATRKHTSLRELQRAIDEHRGVTPTVTPTSPHGVTPSRAHAEYLNTNTALTERERPASVTPQPGGSRYGAVALRLKGAGLPSLNPSHPGFMRLVDAGAEQELVDVVAELRGQPRCTFAYVLSTVEGRRRDAAAAGPVATAAAAPDPLQGLLSPALLAKVRGTQ
ncbi:hypothetical protein GCM10028796_46970 [Ramlibacter monticola]|uniref:Uncharacterized protein n=1 Tax=Ramlibacter monticola TaxID=1926872 RepID=A0A937CVE0_9BURK|nr:hypothetical protein [Ramlibacter monticola]MBL0394321.1 hypothetical protein [Ramlibacter monticola]